MSQSCGNCGRRVQSDSGDAVCKNVEGKFYPIVVRRDYFGEGEFEEALFSFGLDCSQWVAKASFLPKAVSVKKVREKKAVAQGNTQVFELLKAVDSETAKKIIAGLLESAYAKEAVKPTVSAETPIASEIPAQKDSKPSLFSSVILWLKQSRYEFVSFRRGAVWLAVSFFVGCLLCFLVLVGVGVI